MTESRRFQRTGIKAPIRIEFIQGRGKWKIISTNVSNLSAVGAFLPELKSRPVGQGFRADIYFLMEGPNPFCKEGYELITMTVNGHVVRSGPGGTALVFNDGGRLSSRKIVNGQVRIQDVDEIKATSGCFEIVSSTIGKRRPEGLKAVVNNG